MKKSVCFILPGYTDNAVGGYKTVYEICNKLVDRKYNVEIIFDYSHFLRSWSFSSFIMLLKYFKESIFRTKQGVTISWFPLNKSIKLSKSLYLGSKKLKDKNFVIVTSWETAWTLNKIDLPEHVRKIYYIQHYEKYFPKVNVSKVDATIKFPMIRVVTTKWLEEMCHSKGMACVKIPYGLDRDHFKIVVKPELRNPNVAMMLYHKSPDKGSRIGIEASKIVHQQNPLFKLILFGIFEPPDLPEWITYYKSPERAELLRLYNKSSIFISPSLVEGWGLPPCEAAMCGNALCVSDAGGHLEYSVQNETALISKAGDEISLAENILNLINNPEKRLKIAENATSRMKKYDWDLVVDEWEDKVFSAS